MPFGGFQSGGAWSDLTQGLALGQRQANGVRAGRVEWSFRAHSGVI